MNKERLVLPASTKERKEEGKGSIWGWLFTVAVDLRDAARVMRNPSGEMEDWMGERRTCPYGSKCTPNFISPQEWTFLQMVGTLFAHCVAQKNSLAMSSEEKEAALAALRQMSAERREEFEQIGRQVVFLAIMGRFEELHEIAPLISCGDPFCTAKNASNDERYLRGTDSQILGCLCGPSYY